MIPVFLYEDELYDDWYACSCGGRRILRTFSFCPYCREKIEWEEFEKARRECEDEK